MQFADGVYLILLMGLLEDYFVPLYNFFLTPENFEQKASPRSKIKSKGFSSSSPALILQFVSPAGPQCVFCL